MWEVLRLIAVGVGGLVTGVVLASKSGKKDRDASDKRAVKEKLRSEKLARMLEERAKLCETHKDLAAFLIAMTAVGVAVANADGVITPSENKEIDRFVAGVLGSAFPQVVKDQIAMLYADPPSFEDALRVHIAPVSEKQFFDWTLIEEMVDLVAAADGKLHDNERPLRSILARFGTNGGFDDGQG